MRFNTEYRRLDMEDMKRFCEHLLLIVCFLSLSFSLQAQIDFKEIDYIPVSDGTRFLDYPWGGGLNSSQFCDPDLNGDGRRDLLVFEKTENRVLTFIATDQGEYRLDRGYAKQIPAVQGWVITKDMNCDGIDDLFTYNNGSVMVYKGYRDNDTLKFTLWSDGIYYQGYTSRVNLYSTFVDRPAIADFDYDGDLDILTFNVSSNRILLYKNQRVELGLSCDTLAFILKDNCWGNVYESGLSPEIDIRDTCDYKLNNGRLSQAKQMRHAGSTLEAFDIRGRGVLDVLMGDVTFSFLNHLKNNGTRAYASIMAQDTSYPAYNVPVNTYSFPLATFIDVNHDGKKDLIVTPFEGLGVDNYENVLLYENSGTDSVRLSLATKSFIVGDMIDVGENAVPAMIDINGDGLKDLIIGGGYRKQDKIEYYLHYYRNTGNEEYPVFTLEQNNYLNFRASGLTEPYPHAGDLDGDGKMDLLVGVGDGRILYYKNTGAGTGFATGSPVFLKWNNADLDVGQYATPFVIDINKDGKMELLAGEFNGNINLYSNTASPGNVQLTYLTDSVGKVTTTSPFMPLGLSSVAIADIDGDGKYDMIIGGYDNYLTYVSNIEDSIYTRVHPVVIGSLPERIGRKAAPVFGDFTADKDGTLLLGLQTGGVRWFSLAPPDYRPVTVLQNESNGLNFNVYPNPNKGFFTVAVPRNSHKLQWEIIDVMGRICLSGRMESERENISMHQLYPGIYVIQIYDGQDRSGHKLLIKSE